MTDREKALQALENIKAQALEGVRFSDTKIFDFVESNYGVVRSALTAPDAVDVEALRKEYVSAERGFSSADAARANDYRTGWNDCLDELKSKGLPRTADDGWQSIETAPKDEVFVCRNKNKPHVTFEAVLFWDSESWEMPEKYLCLHNMTIDEPIDQKWSELEWRPLPKAAVKK